MRDETIARNYADALFELAQRNEGYEVYGEAIRTVARLLDENPSFASFLATPRIEAAEKKAVIRKAFGNAFPQKMVNFLLITVDKRRQRLLRRIAEEFSALVDEHLGRAHVTVTLAREMKQDSIDRIAERLTALLGMTAIPDVRVKPDILGGIVVRSGDTIYDGSLRRRLDRMKKQLKAADVAAPAAG